MTTTAASSLVRVRPEPQRGNGKLIRQPLLQFLLIFLAYIIAFPAAHADDSTVPAAGSPRDQFNAGTREFAAKKLSEAEELLQSAVASQDSRIQPEALYNLGCVRVTQGAELLKQEKNSKGRANPEHLETMANAADAASHQIDEAIASQNMQQMVMAYLRGGGVRHEIKAATKAVSDAMEKHAEVLAKWQRADGDFRSAVELQPDNADASTNADVTERAIARLIDEMNRMQQGNMKMQAAGRQLGEKMKALKGMIPAPNMPPGAPGDEDEDQDTPGMKTGEQEGAGKPGEEMKISPEEAEQLLNGFKLGGDHGLPFGNKGNGTPRNFSGKNW